MKRRILLTTAWLLLSACIPNKAAQPDAGHGAPDGAAGQDGGGGMAGTGGSGGMAGTGGSGGMAGAGTGGMAGAGGGGGMAGTGGGGSSGTGGAAGCMGDGSGGTGGSTETIVGNWYSIGLANRDLDHSWILSLAIDPTNSDVLYASTAGAGVFKTIDGGGSWLAATTGLGSASGRLIIQASNPSLLYASSGGGVFKTTNGGNTWLPTGSELSSEPVLSLAIDPSQATTLYAGTASRGIFKTTDGGNTWTPANVGLAASRVNVLAVDPRNPEVVYAGSDALAANQNGIFKSTDGGATWAPASAGLASRNVGALAIATLASCSIYASFEGAGGASGNGGVFRSTDGATSWVSAYSTSSGVQALVIDPSHPHIVYAGTDDAGVLVSVDRGVSWNAINGGLPGDISVMELKLDPSDPTIVYAATTNGVFKFTHRLP
jgi:hypothetical protein